MIPIRVTLSGFMCYQEMQTLDFSGDSLWVLIGKNASGKSTVFDAIIFALFGKGRVKGIKNADLVNHQSDRAEIVFDFAIGNSLYRIRRTIDKKGHATRQASTLILKADGLPSELPISDTERDAAFNHWIENDIGLNFDVFTTSILLRQGKADAFLEAETDMRYNLLSQLIDLSKYEALADKAHEWKKHWNAQANMYRQNLDRNAGVTEESLGEVRREISQETKAVTTGRNNVEYLISLFGQAKQWELLNKNMLTNQTHREETNKLLIQKKEIEQNYERWSDLRNILSGLRSVNELAVRISNSEGEISRLAREVKECSGPLKDADGNVASLTKNVEEQENQVEKLLNISSNASEMLGKLTPIIDLLNQIDRDSQDLDRYQNELDGYPENLDDILAHSRSECKRLQENQHVVRDLSRLVSERLKLQTTVKTRQEISLRIRALEGQLPALQQEVLDAQSNVEKADEEEAGTKDALSQAQTRQADSLNRQEQFNQMSDETKCRYCGQKMTETHKAKERLVLQEELKRLEAEVVYITNQHKAALQTLKETKTQLKMATSVLGETETQRRDALRDLEKAEADIEERQDSLMLIYRSLPTNTYKALIAAIEPAGLANWLNTTYPTSEELVAISAEGERLPIQQAEANRLADQQSKRNATRVQLASKGQVLVQSQSRLPSDWQQARSAYNQFYAEGKKTDSELITARKTVKQTRQSLEIAQHAASNLREKQVGRQAALNALQVTFENDQKLLELHIEQLPDNWQAKARKLTPEQLTDLQIELRELAKYEGLHQDLAVANQTLVDIEIRMRDCQTSIDGLPVEAHQSATHVEQKLVAARTATAEAEKRLHNAEQRAQQMESQQKQYSEIETLWKDADRKDYLYGILMEQFGEKGIQKVLINKSEEAIVRLANDMLDNLSGGRSKLKLREAGGNRKALDLEVWDKKTGGDKSLLVGLASGSQRFRIAISLALGIGQYIGRGSHLIESVIIDEGFGSLDSEGRESVVQELHNLRQHLKRIILVSHQEEFSKGFSTGYEIQLVDGASTVKLLDR